MTQNEPTNIAQAIITNIERVIQGQAEQIRLLVASFISGGHVLLEDVPGTGKTTLAKALAKSVELDFQRVQFTPDLLPSDILGVSIFDPQAHKFCLHKGPIFTDILLADEINRASPRTQSALLEAMAEHQVTLDRKQHSLSDFFFVMATQNPIESHGTYPLPEAQMDRFTLCFSLGYVSNQQEIAILENQISKHPIDNLSPCATLHDLTLLRKAAQEVTISPELKQLIVEIVSATRGFEGISMGASPRASLALMKVSQALAIIDGLHFVTTDHILSLVPYVIAHRLALDSDAEYSGHTTQSKLLDIISQINVPT